MSKLNSFKLPEKESQELESGEATEVKELIPGEALKGQKSRSGGGVPLFFEGGQLPLVKRLPLRGFKNRFKKDFSIVNLSDIDNKFNEGDQVNAESLFDLNLIRNKRLNVKILGNGNLNKSLKISVHAVTKSAESKIKKSGSTIELINEQHAENKD